MHTRGSQRPAVIGDDATNGYEFRYSSWLCPGLPYVQTVTSAFGSMSSIESFASSIHGGAIGGCHKSDFLPATSVSLRVHASTIQEFLAIALISSFSNGGYAHDMCFGVSAVYGVASARGYTGLCVRVCACGCPPVCMCVGDSSTLQPPSAAQTAALEVITAGAGADGSGLAPLPAPVSPSATLGPAASVGPPQVATTGGASVALAVPPHPRCVLVRPSQGGCVPVCAPVHSHTHVHVYVYAHMSPSVHVCMWMRGLSPTYTTQTGYSFRIRHGKGCRTSSRGRRYHPRTRWCRSRSGPHVRGATRFNVHTRP
eukprot:GHVU01159996.1.p1 GENE.GHVU01159996.1~~GHVU01159996.1.p1  ORF type:complete len:313 (+),score=-12.09 GHVU01159996.1:223-1161(+)